VGKTYLVTQLMANISKDKKILYVDTEFALNKARVAEIGADPKNIDYYADSRLERVCELLVDSIGKYDVIILDSLAFLTPLSVANAEVGERSIGLFSLLLKHWVLKFRPKLGMSKTAFIAINHHRPAIGLYVTEEPPGGKAWHHACDVRLKMVSNSADKVVKAGKPVGHWIHIQVKKSKVSKPQTTTKIMLNY